MKKKFARGEYSTLGNSVVANNTIISTCCNTYYSEQLATARLFSAAPNLLEALENLVELYNTDEGCKSLPEYINARKAIAKAYGEQND